MPLQRETKLRTYDSQHKRNIIKEVKVGRGDIQIGSIITFPYKGPYSHDPKPMVLVLNPSYKNFLHGLNISYIPEPVLAKLAKLVKVTAAEKLAKRLRIQKIEKLALRAGIGNPYRFYYQRLRKFLNSNLRSTNVAYRIFKHSRMGSVKVVDYKFRGGKFR